MFSRFLSSISGTELRKAFHFMLVVFKLVKLLLVVAATNAACKRIFIAMKHIYKTFLRNTITGNRLIHCIMIHCKKFYQHNMVKVVMDFIGDNQVRLRVFSLPDKSGNPESLKK